MKERIKLPQRKGNRKEEDGEMAIRKGGEINKEIQEREPNRPKERKRKKGRKEGS
jgi:hypothetical protein